jgi:adenine-specific DNA-methyltransferase
MLQLTDAEKRDIVRYIEEGKELPEKYRFLLFDNKRQVELLWNGKSDELTNVVLPFQIIEQVDEPRSEQPITMQGDLFDFSGRQIKGWTNKLIWGDNKYILSSLKNGPMRDEIEENGGIKLIYIDPPFDVGADFTMDVEIGDNTLHKEPNVLEHLAYRDTWGLGQDSFLSMIYERLSLMKDLLSSDGSIYVHCDWRVNSSLRNILDEIFGKENFSSQITFQRTLGHHISEKMDKVTDTILFYNKSDNSIYNPQFKSLSIKELDKKFPFIEKETGRRFTHEKLEQSSNKSSKDENRTIYGKEYKTNLGWRWSQATFDERIKANPLLIHFTEKGKPRYKRYSDEYEGRKINDLWNDISLLSSNSNEALGYPTQKPMSLLERIIKMSSNENDIVCDFFVGSGTTAAVAEKLNRKWICSDIGKFSIHTTRKRILSIQREKKKNRKDYRAFEILNLGNYQKQHFISDGKSIRDENKIILEKKKEKEFEKLILNAFGAESVQGFKTFHGKKAFRMISIGPINQPLSRLHVEEVIKECLKNKITKVDVLGFEYEMGLFPTIQEEAKNKGIDLAYKQIPNEIFDKRAVEKGEVVFHDVAYIEIKPIIKGRMLSVELADFCVFYNQDNVRSLEQSLKNNSSKIIVENGQIVKVSKDKIGIVKKEQLTKNWEDWIDYWSVDYDFESKQEILRLEKEDGSGDYEEKWTGDYVFENEWQSFRTKENRELDLISAEKEINKSTTKLAVKVIDIFGNDTMKIVEVKI